MGTPSPADESPFRFEYDPAVLRFGAGSAADLGDELASHGLDRALVVSGRTVGTSPAVVTPVRDGLGDRLGSVFAETTPKKRLSTAVAAANRFEELDADVLVGLGGGSSLDVAKQTAVVLGSDLSPESLGAELERTGTLPVPDTVPPIVAVPTTLAGADLTQSAGVSANPRHGLVSTPTGGSLGGPGLMPRAVVADPELFATTPQSVLATSAMNGFDKGIETLYSPTQTPVTDGTAMRGLSLLVDSLPALADEPVTAADLNPIVRGLLLVQYGISRPDVSTMSLVHAFGHAISARGPHQGTAHGVVVPHVLRYLFTNVDGRRDRIAVALGVTDQSRGELLDSDDTAHGNDTADAVVEAVTDLRDALGLPDRLRSLDGVEREDRPAIAAAVLDDRLADNVPPGLDLTRADVEGILDAAW